ncbi:MAG: c-type cytochrome [Spirochaetales bacterium]|nr:c-type cytochrome [Spirochaetales bacterium]
MCRCKMIFILVLFGVLLFSCNVEPQKQLILGSYSRGVTTGNLTFLEDLGKQIFFDTDLSEPAGQSCSSCHDPSTGFAEPEQSLPVSEGVIAGRYGGRNAPSAAYASFIPEFNPRKTLGGQFWDGRAADLVEQAKGPFLNPVEMNNPDKAAVVAKVQAASYSALFEQEFGPNAFEDVEAAYHNIAVAIAEYEASTEVNQFSSKFDAVQAGQDHYTWQESTGKRLYETRGKCFICHPDIPGRNTLALMTNFDYRNLGLPANTEFPFNTFPPSTDLGLGVTTGKSKDDGKFKIPSLRNIALTAPYTHNGQFKTLKEMVHFLNTRDIPGEWPGPEVNRNISPSIIGDMGLSDQEEDAIVTYLMTFTDGYRR